MTILWLHISNLNRAVLHRLCVLTANFAIISDSCLFVTSVRALSTWSDPTRCVMQVSCREWNFVFLSSHPPTVPLTKIKCAVISPQHLPNPVVGISEGGLPIPPPHKFQILESVQAPVQWYV